MKKISNTAAALSLILMLASGGLAQIGPGKAGQDRSRGRRAMGLSSAPLLRILQAKKEELNVTDEQLSKIKDLMFAYEEKAIQSRSQNALKKLEIRKLMQDHGSLDYEAIRQNLSESAAVHQDMFIGRLKLREEIHKLLTPEQREALKSLKMERPARGRRPGGRRTAGRPGRGGWRTDTSRGPRQGRAPGRPGFEAAPPIKK